MNQVTIEMRQDVMFNILLKVRCAYQTSGTVSEPGKLFIRIAKGHLIFHVQSRQLVATAWEALDNISNEVEASAVLDFTRFYQIVNTHDTSDIISITFSDPAFIELSSAVGTWKLTTDDRDSYYPISVKGEKCGMLAINDFNKMIRAASNLTSTSKRTVVDNGVRMFHLDSTLNIFFSSVSEAAILSNKLDKPLSSDFDVFIKNWILKRLEIPGDGEISISLNLEQEALILDGDKVKYIIAVSTDESINWESVSQGLEDPSKQIEFVSINKLALSAAITRLNQVSEGTVDLQVLGKRKGILHSHLRTGDRGDEHLVINAGVDGDLKGKLSPTKTTLVLDIALLKNLVNIDTDQDDITFKYGIDTKTGITDIAVFRGKLYDTGVSVQVVTTVGR